MASALEGEAGAPAGERVGAVPQAQGAGTAWPGVLGPVQEAAAEPQLADETASVGGRAGMSHPPSALGFAGVAPVGGIAGPAEHSRRRNYSVDETVEPNAGPKPSERRVKQKPQHSVNKPSWLLRAAVRTWLVV